MYAYPDSISIDDWTMILNVLKGVMPDPKAAAHAVWEGIGYALGRFYADVPVKKLAAEKADKAAAIKAIEQHLATKAVGDPKGFNWKNLLVVLIQELPAIIALFGA